MSLSCPVWEIGPRFVVIVIHELFRECIKYVIEFRHNDGYRGAQGLGYSL